MAVTVGSVAGSGGRTPTPRPPGSVTTFAATHREALSLATEVPASTYVMVPSESRQPYPEKPAAAYTVESTGQTDGVVWTGVFAHTTPIAYGSRSVPWVGGNDEHGVGH